MKKYQYNFIVALLFNILAVLSAVTWLQAVYISLFVICIISAVGHWFEARALEEKNPFRANPLDTQ